MIRCVRRCRRRGSDMGRVLKCVAALALSVLLLTGCSSSGRDTRYLQSEQRPPLIIPPGLATPPYNKQMRVPSVAAAVDVSVDLERPPTLIDTQ